MALADYLRQPEISITTCFPRGGLQNRPDSATAAVGSFKQ